MLATCIATIATAADGNRLAYLDEVDPYYPHRTFPKLVTPQWVGEPGVEAVIVLAIDDMREHEKWEAYLRPILERLKKIDGRAPVSIMTCKINPDDPHLQTWLKEGLSLEVHTIDHPCPLLCKGDFAAAKSTYDRCVDQMAAVPNNKPVAFRTPCCDSLNTVSPRIFAEIINKKTDKGHFLQMDSSVFNYFTPNDPDLKREWVTEGDGRSRFAKYFPADRDFVNTIEDYPYPYPIGRLCWEFPCATPSDWQAQKLHKANNEITVRDWYACLDATIKKQGTMNMVFHPHGWIESKQIVQLIDYAVETYGKKVKFLTFNEALERINKNLLGGQPLRDPKTGGDNGVLLLDVNNDGYMDVVIGNEVTRVCRIWSPSTRKWVETPFAFDMRTCHFGAMLGTTCALNDTNDGPKMWKYEFDPVRAGPDAPKVAGLPNLLGRFRLLDLDGDGNCEIIAENEASIYTWNRTRNVWQKLDAKLPHGANLGRFDSETGLRFVDLDGDGKLDIIVSNENGYVGLLFRDFDSGWPTVAFSGTPAHPNPMMPISLKFTNNGAFIKNRHIYWQNEYTDGKPDLLERWSFNQLLSTTYNGPKSLEQSLKLMTVRPGYKVELVAHEPQVQDPIAIAWGPDGRMWVVEMGDYPLGLDGKGKVGGKIKVLESTRHDGNYDKATVFLDNIGFPTGILPWRKGVLITAAPDILYAEDTTGNGKADVVKKLFMGFVEGNQQHRVNGLVWGLDNWVYCANGDSGGTIASVATGKKLDMRGRDIRIKPDTGEMELTSGQSQYNKIRDDWGNWFGANNSIPGWHVALEDRQLARNPSFATPQAVNLLVTNQNGSVVYPTSRTLPRFNDPGAYNRFTSVCGIGTYRDELFEPALQRALFVCEPVHNLVHRMDLAPQGSTFVGRRAVDETRTEFLSSADNWFRPVMARTGPDGALYVVDMYRAVIEHPEWIPRDIQKQLDLRAGHDMGRIYRVSRVGEKLRPFPDFRDLGKALDSPNGWQRDMAHMMLVWQNDKKTVEPLEKMAHESKNPFARLHALCALDGMNAVKPEVLRAALSDEHPGVLAHAVRLSESRFAADSELGPAVLKLVAKPELALPIAGALGGWDDSRAGIALGTILQAHADDRFIVATALSSLTAKNFPAVAEEMLRDPAHRPSANIIEGLMAFAVSRGDAGTLGKLLADAATPKDGVFTAGQFDLLAALMDAWARGKKSPADTIKDGGPEIETAWAKVEAAFKQALKQAADAKATPADRLAAIRLLGHRPIAATDDRTTLAGLLDPQAPSDVQVAAVAALARIGDKETPALLLKGWKGYSPAVRTAVMSAVLDRDRWIPAVLTALERKDVLPAEVDAAARHRLLAHIMPTVRVQASKIFAGAADADRDKVIALYKPALTKPGDRERGKQIFTKSCAACHKLGDVGRGLGPDLTALSDKSADYLLTNILDPNRAVEARYLAYTAVTTDGRSRVGFLLSETATSLTLVSTDGQEHTILRTDLDSLTGSGKSVMPEGLEKDVTIDQMADLLAFLRASVPAPKPKVMPGNKPEVIRATADGSLTLPATAAEVFGTTLVLEAQYKNLGFWSSADDRAAWTMQVPSAGRYEVWLDWACPKEDAGKAFTVEAGATTLTARVEATASWDEYKQAKIGELKLDAGDTRLMVRPGLPLKGNLMDLRTMRLVLVKEKK
jgi:putative membrane-bound dehydrogenase-like protein